MRFLTALDENAAEFCFRTFADATASSGVRPRNYTGSLDEHRTALARANATGAGVFVVVNHGGHAAAAIDRIRAVFVDLDGAELEPVLQCALEPHMVIESSPGRYHAYWFCDGVPVEKFRAVQQAIAARFGGDPAVCDPSRVMRVPGTTWHKGLKPHVVTIIKENCGQRYSAEQILAEFPPTLLTPKPTPALHTGEVITAGNRHHVLISTGAKLRNIGLDSEAIEAALMVVNRTRCEEPKSATEVKDIARWCGARDSHDAWYGSASETLIAGTPDTTGSRIKFTLAGDLLSQPKPLRWAVRGVLLEGSMTAVIGGAGTFKSVAAIDISAAIATGTDWHGRPTKQGACFYVAGEGNHGLARRLKAWELDRRVSLAAAPLYLSAGGIGLIEPLNAATVAAEVERLARAHDAKPTLVTVDTLARCFGPGNANDAADMGRVIENLDRHVREPFACSVLIVHHTGIADNGRARGSSSLRAALDTEILFERTGDTVSMKCTKSKDAPEFEPMTFTRHVIELPWPGEDGSPETSFVLRPADTCSLNRREIGLGENQREALRVLREIRHEKQQSLIDAGANPSECRIFIDDWRTRASIDRRRFAETKKQLSARGLIRLSFPYVEVL